MQFSMDHVHWTLALLLCVSLAVVGDKSNYHISQVFASAQTNTIC